MSEIAWLQQSSISLQTGAVTRDIKPSRFELPKAARIILWTFAVFFILWVLWGVVTLAFFPGMYR
jgi:hypothetical protein